MNAFPTNVYERSNSSPRMLFQRIARTVGHMVFESPAQQTVVIDSIWLACSSAGSATIRIHHLAPRATDSQENALAYDLTVPPSSVIVIEGPIYMSAGDILWVKADTATRITVTGYGRIGP